MKAINIIKNAKREMNNLDEIDLETFEEAFTESLESFSNSE